MVALDEGRRIHAEATVVDSHNDTIVSLLRRGGQSLGGEGLEARDAPTSAVAYLRDPLDSSSPPVQADLPKLRAGGVDVAYFAIDVTRAWGNHLLYAMDGWVWFFGEVLAHRDEIAVIGSIEDARRARAEGKVAAVLTVENSEVLEGSLNVLPVLRHIGVRAITLTHSARARAADGVDETATGGGLTGFGRDLVREMNRLGVLIDVSHISESGFWDVMALSGAPVLASHSCCKALCEQPRNLTDDQIRAIAEGGGVIGITFVRDFVDREKPTMNRLLDHIEHAVAVGGIGCVGIGSDFDGGGELLKDAGEIPLITQGLLDRGWGEADLRKFLGENHLRLFETVCG